jgi:hypothetical protein
LIGFLCHYFGYYVIKQRKAIRLDNHLGLKNG